MMTFFLNTLNFQKTAISWSNLKISVVKSKLVVVAVARSKLKIQIKTRENRNDWKRKTQSREYLKYFEVYWTQDIFIVFIEERSIGEKGKRRTKLFCR
jgi:uncharacterized membrane protein YbhN (UPF0104 family)